MKTLLTASLNAQTQHMESSMGFVSALALVIEEASYWYSATFYFGYFSQMPNRQ